MTIEQLDRLFESYNYKTAESSNKDVRTYTLRYGMYHAAEIIVIGNDSDVDRIKSEYSGLGYATEVKHLSENLKLEEYLFQGFFIKTPFGNELKSRYKSFVSRQIQNLPDDSSYEYIQSDYNLMIQDPQGAVI